MQLCGIQPFERMRLLPGKWASRVCHVHQSVVMKFVLTLGDQSWEIWTTDCPADDISNGQ